MVLFSEPSLCRTVLMRGPSDALPTSGHSVGGWQRRDVPSLLECSSSLRDSRIQLLNMCGGILLAFYIRFNE
jgi:hypothetical protein